MKPIHVVQMLIAGLLQGAMVLAVAEPQLAHFILIGSVVLVAVLSPLGLASPAMLTPNSTTTALITNVAAPPPASAPSTVQTSSPLPRVSP